MQDLKRDLSILTNDYVWLRTHFSLFHSLFGPKRERIDLMNKASSFFFVQVQEALIATIITGIFRVAGSQVSGRGPTARKNLVLSLLLDTSIYGEWSGREGFEIEVNKVKETLRPLKEIRHKSIAHRDLEIARGEIVSQNPEFGEIREAVEAMGAAIQVAQAKINNTTYVLEPVGPIEDELHVLDLIRIGIEISEKENEAEFEAAKEGNHNYERCYSERPDWLFDD
tara:strand:+ start:116 stop:793 length:678 start_codon:yes stop_codon:yes gene_type:complete